MYIKTSVQYADKHKYKLTVFIARYKCKAQGLNSSVLTLNFSQ